MAEPNVVQNIVNRHWTITGGSGGSGYCVSRADELTATFKWGASMESTLVRGSPYATARFSGANVRISTEQGTRSVPEGFLWSFPCVYLGGDGVVFGVSDTFVRRHTMCLRCGVL